MKSLYLLSLSLIAGVSPMSAGVGFPPPPPPPPGPPSLAAPPPPPAPPGNAQ